MLTAKSKRIYLDSLTIREKRLFYGRILESKKNKNYCNLLNVWKLKVGETSEEFFKKRLEWAGIENNELETLLNPVKSFEFDNHPIPEWVFELQRFQDQYLLVENVYKNVRGFKEIPFSDFLAPFVEFFSRNMPWDNSHLSKNAIYDLKRDLLTELSRIASQSLLEQMMSYDLNYDSFVKESKEEGYVSFFTEYPYLTRLIFTRGMFWFENTKSFIISLRRDCKQLSKMLNDDTIFVKSIVGSLSETHNKGKNVMIIETLNSHKFLYKQRSTDIEEKFFKIIEYLNSRMSLKQYVPWLLNRKTYSWMEFVEYRESTTIKDVKKYYKRCGYLLCLFYVLGTTDLHSENIITSGEYPVFIDLETLITPLTLLNNKNINKLNDYIDRTYGLSVSRVGILPQWMLGPDTNVYSNSAIGGSKSSVLYPTVVWKNINKDNMYYEYVEQPAEEGKNKVFCNKIEQNPHDYLSEITLGFSTFYNFLLENRNNRSFMKKIKSLSNLSSRFVFRATKVYTLLLDYLNHPDYMKNGVSRSLEFEILAKGLLLDTSKKYIFWNIFEDELKHLEINDIPHYFCNTSNISVSSIYGKIYERAFQYSGIDKVTENIRNLSENDRDFQMGIIKNSINTSLISEYLDNPVMSCTDYLKEYSRRDIERLVLEISDRVIESKIEVDGRCTWVSYVSNVVSHTYGYKPIGLDIANGNMGVAVFLGAVYRYTGDSRYLKEIDLAIQPIADVLKYSWSSKEFISRFETGITTGVSSVIYGFVKLFEFTGRKKYLKYAIRFANLVTDGDVVKATRQDIVSGNAGLLLSMVSLYELRGDKVFLDRINFIYDLLIKKGFNENDFLNWDYQENKKLIGFSHGSSGVLYAISVALPYLRNYKSAIKKIEAIINYEDNHYNSIKNNWYDYRFDKPNIEIVSWCHGGLGVGMSRFELLAKKINLNKIKKDIKNSIKKVLETKEHFLDTICCGNGGRIDMMLEIKNLGIGSKYTDDYLEKIIRSMIFRYEKDGDFRYFSKFSTKDLNVGFFQGITGIGYELLRYLDQKTFPSILLFK